MYRLVITNAARRDIDAIYAYWATNRSRDEAVKWYIEIGDAIDQLRRSPESNSLAIEVPPFSDELRQLLFGVGRRKTHRVIYAIVGQTMHVLRVRHTSQQPLDPDDLPPISS